MILVGLIALGGGSYDAYRTYQARGWPTADAEILSSDVERVFVGRRKGGHAWFPRIRYSYTVEGRTYSGSRVGVAEDSLLVRFKFDSGGYNHKNATAIANRYPVGAQVAVKYNPEHHEEAVLDANMSATTTYFLVIGGIALLVGLIGLALTRR